MKLRTHQPGFKHVLYGCSEVSAREDDFANMVKGS